MSNSSPKLAQICYFPIKGFSAHFAAESDLTGPGGLPDDRIYAFAYLDELEAGSRCESVTTLPKTVLVQQNDWPALGRLVLAFDRVSGRISMRDGARATRTPEVVADPEEPTGRLALEEFLNAFLARETRGAGAHSRAAPDVRLVGSRARRSRFPDRPGVDVTFVSARTLADLEARYGVPIDIRRFRINLLIDDLPAWSEESLAGKTVAIGDALLRVKGPVRRCFNINVNPDAGERDLPLLEWLKPNLGHVVVGYTAVVEKSGRVSVGDDFVYQLD